MQHFFWIVNSKNVEIIVNNAFKINFNIKKNLQYDTKGKKIWKHRREADENPQTSLHIFYSLSLFGVLVDLTWNIENNTSKKKASAFPQPDWWLYV